jgi:hypothetical protein
MLTACNALDNECIRHPRRVDLWAQPKIKRPSPCGNNISHDHGYTFFFVWCTLHTLFLLVHTRTLTVPVTESESCLLIGLSRKKQHHFFPPKSTKWPTPQHNSKAGYDIFVRCTALQYHHDTCILVIIKAWVCCSFTIVFLHNKLSSTNS